MLVKLFNENFMNVVEISSDNKPSSSGICEDNVQDNATVDEIISKYKAHPSVQKSKKNMN